MLSTQHYHATVKWGVGFGLGMWEKRCRWNESGRGLLEGAYGKQIQWCDSSVFSYLCLRTSLDVLFYGLDPMYHLI